MRAFKIDKVDIVFIVVCCVLTALVWFRPPSGAARPLAASVADGIQVDDRLDAIIPLGYRASGKSFLVVVNSKCTFCTDSMPFYSRLAAAANSCGSQVTFVSTEAPDVARGYVQGHGLNDPRVLTVSREQLKQPRYPTILLVDQSATVLQRWLGRLAPEREAQVMAFASCDSSF